MSHFRTMQGVFLNQCISVALDSTSWGLVGVWDGPGAIYFDLEPFCALLQDPIPGDTLFWYCVNVMWAYGTGSAVRRISGEHMKLSLPAVLVWCSSVMVEGPTTNEDTVQLKASWMLLQLSVALPTGLGQARHYSSRAEVWGFGFMTHGSFRMLYLL